MKIPSTVIVSPSGITVEVGTTFQLTATCNYPDGLTQDATASAKWTSTDPNVAVLVPNVTATVQTKAIGPVRIIATVEGMAGQAPINVVGKKP